MNHLVTKSSDIIIRKVSAETLTDAQKLAWDALPSTSLCGPLFSSPAWCHAMALSDGVSQQYFLAYRDDQLVGVLTADLMPASMPEHYHLQDILEGNRLVKGITPWKSPYELMPVMLATTRSGRICDIRLDSNLSHEDQSSILRVLILAFEEAGHIEGSKSTALLYIPENVVSFPFHGVLEQEGYTRAHVGVYPYIPVSFTDIDGYLALFHSKRRTSIRKELKAFEQESSVTIRRTPLLEGLDDFVEMIGYNFDKYDFSFDPNKYRERTRIISNEFGENAFLLEMIWYGKIVGSCLFIYYKGLLYPRAVGIDPTLPKNLYPYFNLVYYHSIHLATELHAHRIVVGPELYETKITRGCALERLALYMKTDDPALIERLHQIDSFMKARTAQWDMLYQSNIKFA